MSAIPCAHQFVPSDHACYVICGICGTYHSTDAPPPEQIYGAGYWNRPDHSSLRDQVYNLEVHEEGGITKNAFVLQRIEVADRSAVLEIGCAPGSLLRRLKQDAEFERVVGIDTDAVYEADIHDISGGGCDLVFGYFPVATNKMNRSSFSLIVGCDVFEHIHEPEAFLAECARLLKPGGQLILMLPLVGSGDCALPNRFFASAEHVFLHSMQHMEMLFGCAGFGMLRFSGWTAGHEVVSARKAT